MSKSCMAQSPKRALPCAVYAVPMLLALGLAGCSTRVPDTASHYARVSSSPVYSSDVAAAASSAVEVEDDGIAVQTPPMLRQRPGPDDPREPFSPNYGRESLPPANAANPLDAEIKAQLKRVSMIAE